MSYLNPDSGLCFVEIGSYILVHQEIRWGNWKSETKEVTPYPVWAIQIYNAYSEGADPPSFGEFYDGKDGRMSCHIFLLPVPFPRSDSGGIECRSKEEFDDLASNHFGISKLTKIAPIVQTEHPVPTAASASPVTVPDNALPPNTKMSAVPVDGDATSEQFWEDAKYCYQHPANFLKDSNGEILSCSEVNTMVEARAAECKARGPKEHPENCKGYLRGYKDLRKSRPRG